MELITTQERERERAIFLSCHRTQHAPQLTRLTINRKEKEFPTEEISYSLNLEKQRFVISFQIFFSKCSNSIDEDYFYRSTAMKELRLNEDITSNERDIFQIFDENLEDKYNENEKFLFVVELMADLLFCALFTLRIGVRYFA